MHNGHVTTAEAARLLGINERRVRRLAQDGRIIGLTRDRVGYWIPTPVRIRLSADRMRMISNVEIVKCYACGGEGTALTLPLCQVCAGEGRIYQQKGMQAT